MRVPSRDNVVEKLAAIRAGVRHAFATQPESMTFSQEDEALMARVAEVIVRRDMAAPATVFLESMGPMNFLGSQTLHFFAPILECAVSVKDVEHVARLLERRDSIPRLIALIDAKSAPKRATDQ
jgi:hypothetical protein